MKQHARSNRFTSLSNEDLESVSGGTGNGAALANLRRLEILEQEKAKNDFQKILEQERAKSGRSELDSPSGGDESGFRTSENDSGFSTDGADTGGSLFADASGGSFGDSSGGSFGDWSDFG